jgi:hypothetical protein
MLPRRTQESYRPRVSNRTMVAILQSSRLLVSRNEWRRHDREMKPQGEKKTSPLHATKRKRTADLRKTTRRPRVNVQGVGLDAETKILWPSSRWGSISLDIPFYRTAPTNLLSNQHVRLLLVFQSEHLFRLTALQCAPSSRDATAE